MAKRLTDEKTGLTTHRIRDDGRITDELTGLTTQRLRDDGRITEEKSGETTHRVRDGRRLTDEKTAFRPSDSRLRLTPRRACSRGCAISPRSRRPYLPKKDAAEVAKERARHLAVSKERDGV